MSEWNGLATSTLEDPVSQGIRDPADDRYGEDSRPTLPDWLPQANQATPGKVNLPQNSQSHNQLPVTRGGLARNGAIQGSPWTESEEHMAAQILLALGND